MNESLPQVYERLQKELKARPAEVLDLDLASLARIYLAELEKLLPESFEKASEYLCFTSHLIYLKSRLLLPRETSPSPEKTEEPFPEALEKADSLGEVLQAREILGWDVFCSTGVESPEPEIEADLNQLVAAMVRVLERQAPPTVELKRLEPLFKQMLLWVMEELENRKKLTFSDLSKTLSEKIEKLALLLALLDLSFREVCLLVQNIPWGEIEILLRE